MSFKCKIGIHSWDGYRCKRCSKERRLSIFTDARDGNVYKCDKIGNQIWMAENFRYYVNKGCWAYDNNENYAKKYGYLYDFDTAKKVCPKGWHLPSKAEWQKSAGRKLKKKKFSAQYGGFMSTSFNANSFSFYNLGDFGCWWTSTKFGPDYNVYSIYLSVFAIIHNIVFDDSIECNGFSVRYLKD